MTAGVVDDVVIIRVDIGQSQRVGQLRIELLQALEHGLGSTRLDTAGDLHTVFIESWTTAARSGEIYVKAGIFKDVVRSNKLLSPKNGWVLGAIVKSPVVRTADDHEHLSHYSPSDEA